MADFVEQLSDVELQNPIDMPAPLSRRSHGVQGRLPRPVAIGVRQEDGFHVRLESHFDDRLRHAICYRGTPRMRSPPFFFGMATAFTGGGKYVPDDIRFQSLYRLFFKSASKSAIDCSSTPQPPALALTALKASYTSVFGMLNGFAALTAFLLFPVVSTSAAL